MSRRPLAATALALLLPLVGISGQTRVTGVLRGSLVLLPAPVGSAQVSVTPVGSVGRAAAARQAPVRTVVRTTRQTLEVWAPAAQRIELRVQGDSVPKRPVECHRVPADSTAPATCDADEALPAHAILTIYLGLDGSR